ncbi:MAG: tRNA lysidine(34) synthetase TilS [Coriobacteriales bacterium]|jgi:tRNA(Ile)-lysidine synthase TilS/MesJ|nr:tRNA lysidine(34) synthetase TilS [Coriobacteriales bacterium]
MRKNKEQPTKLLLSTVLDTVERHNMFSCSLAPLVLMVSGGSDSVALAMLARELWCFDGRRCAILHVNHMLRGKQADADESFVRELGERLQIPVYVKRIDVMAITEQTPNGNIEQVGREQRYAAAFELLKKLTSSDVGLDGGLDVGLDGGLEGGLKGCLEGCQDGGQERCQDGGLEGNLEANLDGDKDVNFNVNPGDNLERTLRNDLGGNYNGNLSHTIGDSRKAPFYSDGRIVTAHTLNDRAETFLMRVIVGGGTGSLSSTPYCNANVIRPLLDCSREQLRGYLLSCNQGWREDLTNADTRRSRAFVRHEVIPLLKNRNPAFLMTLKSTMDVLAVDDAELDAQADALFLKYAKEDLPEKLALDLDIWKSNIGEALLRRVVYRACKLIMPAAARPTFAHITKIVKHANNARFATDIPGDVTVRSICGKLVFRKKTAEEKPKHDPRKKHSPRKYNEDAKNSNTSKT